jgi:oleate hydratase
MSVMLYDRDYFPRQKELNQDVLWGDGLFGENIGNYIRKPMAECTGNEILEEMLYHFNMLDIKDDVISHAYVSTCMMPYITSQFMPRTVTDRPRVIPDGCTNLAFIGQYVEVPGDVVFTIETSVRTPMEAVYQLTKLDKEILEVYPCRYDVRFFVERMKKFAGVSGNLTEEDLPKINPFELKKQISELLNQLNAIPPYYIMYQGRDKNIALKDSVLNPQYPKEK